MNFELINIIINMNNSLNKSPDPAIIFTNC